MNYANAIEATIGFVLGFCKQEKYLSGAERETTNEQNAQDARAHT